ncbi:hypothetical protein ACW0US_07245 [Xanthomonas euvesicatoria]
MSIPGDAECDRLMREAPRLFIQGHSHKRGYAIQREYQRGDETRYFVSRTYAFALVARWNRMAQRRVAMGVYGGFMEPTLGKHVQIPLFGGAA